MMQEDPSSSSSCRCGGRRRRRKAVVHFYPGVLVRPIRPPSERMIAKVWHSKQELQAIKEQTVQAIHALRCMGNVCDEEDGGRGLELWVHPQRLAKRRKIIQQVLAHYRTQNDNVDNVARYCQEWTFESRTLAHVRGMLDAQAVASSSSDKQHQQQQVPPSCPKSVGARQQSATAAACCLRADPAGGHGNRRIAFHNAAA